VARSARLDRAKVLTAATCLTNAAEGRDFMMHARIAVLGAAGEAGLRKARIRPRRKPSLEQIAADFDLSVGHFSRAFRISTGLPPHQWLLRQRPGNREVI
jgi:AraC-like DNA-binding protein